MAKTEPQITWVPIERLKSLEFGKIRNLHTDAEEFQNLQRSMAQDGFDPSKAVLARRIKDLSGNPTEDLQICDGHHRTEAARSVGIKMVPVYIDDTITDEDMYRKQFIFNEFVPTTHREKVTYLKMFMLQHPLMSSKDVALKHNMNPQQLYNLMKLERLIKPAADLLDQGKLTPSAANTLATVPERFQHEFLEQAIAMPVDKFIQHVQSNRDRIRQAQSEGKDLIKLEFPPTRRDLKELVFMMEKAEKDLQAANPEDVANYQWLSGRFRALQEVLCVDDDTIAYEKQKKEAEKNRKRMERAQKKQEEAAKTLEALRQQQEFDAGVNQPQAAISGI